MHQPPDGTQRARGKAGRTDYTDELLPGFVLRVSGCGARESRSYCVRYGARGDRRMTLGDARKLSLGDARDEARAVLGRVAKGDDPAAARAAARKADEAERRRKADGRDTLQGLAERLVGKAELGDSTRRSWNHILSRHIVPALGSREPASVTRADVRDLVGRIAERAPAAANDVLKVLRWVYARAIENELVETTPCLGVRKPTKERPRDRVATDDELRALWTAAGEQGTYGQAVRLALLLPARRGEIFGAAWSEMDLDARLWRIPAARTKNAQVHELPLPQAALDLLEAVRAASPSSAWVFPGRVEGRTREGLGLVTRPLAPTSKAWDELTAAAKLADVGLTFHDLRRTIRDRMTRDLDVSLPVAEACIGHVPPRLIRTYNPSGVALRDKLNALDRWSRELARIVERRQPERVVTASFGRP